jgi:hypothetical protein
MPNYLIAFNRINTSLTSPCGEACPWIHGDIDVTCGDKFLHPHRLEEREEHTNSVSIIRNTWKLCREAKNVLMINNTKPTY